MKHVLDLWFERASVLDRRTGSRGIYHVLVVVTDLLSDMEMLDTGSLDDLDVALRETYPADDVRFLPPRFAGGRNTF
jgi:hypothetical protein